MKCTSDGQCGSKGKCSTPHCVKGINDGKECSTNADCSEGTCGSAVKYDLTRTRFCNDPSAGTDSCKWDKWSDCKGGDQYCGDGVVSGTEECDKGKANSDSGECTKQCMKNFCGDGNVFSGVESCDSGSQNGQTCTAPYGGNCLLQ